MAKQKNSLKSPVTFSLGTVLLFVLAFGVVGGYALWKSFAAPAPPATLVASPSPAVVGGNEVFTGCGYYPNVGVSISIWSPYAASSIPGGPANSSGCIDSSKYETWNNEQPGTYTVKAYQYPPNQHHSKQKLMASTSYTAQ